MLNNVNVSQDCSLHLRFEENFPGKLWHLFTKIHHSNYLRTCLDPLPSFSSCDELSLISRLKRRNNYVCWASGTNHYPKINRCIQGAVSVYLPCIVHHLFLDLIFSISYISFNIIHSMVWSSFVSHIFWMSSTRVTCIMYLKVRFELMSFLIIELIAHTTRHDTSLIQRMTCLIKLSANLNCKSFLFRLRNTF